MQLKKVEKKFSQKNILYNNILLFRNYQKRKKAKQSLVMAKLKKLI